MRALEMEVEEDNKTLTLAYREGVKPDAFALVRFRPFEVFLWRGVSRYFLLLVVREKTKANYVEVAVDLTYLPKNVRLPSVGRNEKRLEKEPSGIENGFAQPIVL
ncbi:MAG: hypothetical protein ACPL3C_02135 [Pyrobaculum sp.]|uniref:hypothetical protein n=1 Tax=Pyrobaculum sp. TaxID=2004705 RepID=UPI003CA23326